MAYRLGLIASVRLGGRKGIQSVKSARSTFIQSLTFVSFPFSREIIKDVKWTCTHRHTYCFFFVMKQKFPINIRFFFFCTNKISIIYSSSYLNSYSITKNCSSFFQSLLICYFVVLYLKERLIFVRGSSPKSWFLCFSRLR